MASRIVHRAPLSQSGSASTHTSPASSPPGGRSGITSSQFSNHMSETHPFSRLDPIVPLVVYTESELKREVESMRKDFLEKADGGGWKAWVGALQRLASVASGGIASDPVLAKKFVKLIRSTIHIMVAEHIASQRSLVASEACRSVSVTALSLGPLFAPLAEVWLPQLLGCSANSTETFSAGGHVAVLDVLNALPEGSPAVLKQILGGTKANGGVKTRQRCTGYLLIVLARWSWVERGPLEPYIDEVGSVVERGIEEPDDGVRTSARQVFCVMQRRGGRLQQAASRIMDKVRPSTQKRLVQESQSFDVDALMNDGGGASIAAPRSNTLSGAYSRESAFIVDNQQQHQQPVTAGGSARPPQRFPTTHLRSASATPSLPIAANGLTTTREEDCLSNTSSHSSNTFMAPHLPPPTHQLRPKPVRVGTNIGVVIETDNRRAQPIRVSTNIGIDIDNNGRPVGNTNAAIRVRQAPGASPVGQSVPQQLKGQPMRVLNREVAAAGVEQTQTPHPLRVASRVEDPASACSTSSVVVLPPPPPSQHELSSGSNIDIDVSVAARAEALLERREWSELQKLLTTHEEDSINDSTTSAAISEYLSSASTLRTLPPLLAAGIGDHSHTPPSYAIGALCLVGALAENRALPIVSSPTSLATVLLPAFGRLSAGEEKSVCDAAAGALESARVSLDPSLLCSALCPFAATSTSSCSTDSDVYLTSERSRAGLLEYLATVVPAATTYFDSEEGGAQVQSLVYRLADMFSRIEPASGSKEGAAERIAGVHVVEALCKRLGVDKIVGVSLSLPGALCDVLANACPEVRDAIGRSHNTPPEGTVTSHVVDIHVVNSTPVVKTQKLQPQQTSSSRRKKHAHTHGQSPPLSIHKRQNTNIVASDSHSVVVSEQDPGRQSLMNLSLTSTPSEKAKGLKALRLLADEAGSQFWSVHFNPVMKLLLRGGGTTHIHTNSICNEVVDVENRYLESNTLPTSPAKVHNWQCKYLQGVRCLLARCTEESARMAPEISVCLLQCVSTSTDDLVRAEAITALSAVVNLSLEPRKILELSAPFLTGAAGGVTGRREALRLLGLLIPHIGERGLQDELAIPQGMLLEGVLGALLESDSETKLLAVLAIVEIYQILGEVLLPYIAHMPKHHLKLITIYIEKRRKRDGKGTQSEVLQPALVC